jgi:hypothetical protein
VRRNIEVRQLATCSHDGTIIMLLLDSSICWLLVHNSAVVGPHGGTTGGDTIVEILFTDLLDVAWGLSYYVSNATSLYHSTPRGAMPTSLSTSICYQCCTFSRYVAYGRYFINYFAAIG